MPEFVRITDVAPRDGLQNEPGIIPSSAKIELVKRISSAGVDEVEVSSFVSPKWIPQLADAADVFAALHAHKPAGCMFSALVPNEKGALAAITVNQTAGGPLIDKLSVFTAASETFSQRNTNASIAETIERFRPVIALTRSNGLLLRAYISCVVRCPFEGPISPDRVAEVSARLVEIGADEIDLGDTIGAGTPETVHAMLATVIARLGSAWTPRLTLHLHDTFNTAAACVRPALDIGIRSFDAAAGGLGGCPYASTAGKRAPGNIDTGILVAAIRASGFSTRVDATKLALASDFARTLRTQ